MALGSSVDVEVRELVEFLVASLTDKVLHIQMDCIHVVLEVALLSKSHLASSIVASKRLLTGMSSEVAIELALVEHQHAALDPVCFDG